MQSERLRYGYALELEHDARPVIRVELLKRHAGERRGRRRAKGTRQRVRVGIVLVEGQAAAEGLEEDDAIEHGRGRRRVELDAVHVVGAVRAHNRVTGDVTESGCEDEVVEQVPGVAGDVGRGVRGRVGDGRRVDAGDHVLEQVGRVRRRNSQARLNRRSRKAQRALHCLGVGKLSGERRGNLGREHRVEEGSRGRSLGNTVHGGVEERGVDGGKNGRPVASGIGGSGAINRVHQRHRRARLGVVHFGELRVERINIARERDSGKVLRRNERTLLGDVLLHGGNTDRDGGGHDSNAEFEQVDSDRMLFTLRDCKATRKMHPQDGLHSGLALSVAMYLVIKLLHKSTTTTSVSIGFMALVAAAKFAMLKHEEGSETTKSTKVQLVDTQPVVAGNTRTLESLADVLGRVTASVASQQKLVQNLKADADARDNKMAGRMGVIQVDLTHHSAQQKQLAAEAHYDVMRKLLGAAYETN